MLVILSVTIAIVMEIVIPAMVGVFVGGSTERVAWTVAIAACIVSALFHWFTRGPKT